MKNKAVLFLLNTFGHPAFETLQRLENFGIHTLRTGESGGIKIVSDGNNLKIVNKQ
ncbi:MAG: hypothetical protein HY005_03185 [Candidatus Staskawiczbacteria bacterium]|nr:hypothetical protein [Candidatus Staskawiczbacteria bacterium]MBI3337598.1 hypothetical protein [Candidatus Staskawiczbacteria bacterium]